MTKPLALLYYKNLLPGTQLVNRLEDLGYRVQALNQSSDLVPLAERERPMLVLVDLTPHTAEVCATITELKQNPATSHLPVLAFAGSSDDPTLAAAREAGAKMVCGSTAILNHLPQLLEQVLEMD